VARVPTTAEVQGAAEDDHLALLPGMFAAWLHEQKAHAWADGYNHGLSEGQRQDGYVSPNPYVTFPEGQS
jgi:hypothetical protein